MVNAQIELEYVVLRCRDLEQSRAFYSALGLELAQEQHGKGAPHYSCNLGRVVIELYPLVGKESAGVRLGLRLVSVRSAVTAAVKAGATVVRLDVDAIVPSAVLRDPDGHEIAIVEEVGSGGSA
jgi:lactoylglutathione lyase